MSATVICLPDVNPVLYVGTDFLEMMVNVEATNVLANSTAPQAFILGLDVSPSMEQTCKGDPNRRAKIAIAREVGAAAIRSLPETAYVAVVPFASYVREVFALRPATEENREAAAKFVETVRTHDGTHLSSMFEAARTESSKAPAGAAITLYGLTDGDDNSPGNSTLVQQYTTPAPFIFEARGIGEDYNVKLLRMIANKLDGREKYLKDLDAFKEDLAEVISVAMSRGLRNMRIHLWAPKLITISGCIREFPDPKVDLMDQWIVQPGCETDRYLPIGKDGVFGEEAQDTYLTLKVPPAKTVDGTRTAGRISVMWEEGGQPFETPPAEIIVSWTTDRIAASRKPEGILHYRDASGVTKELQEALDDLDANRASEATTKLARVREKARTLGDTEKVEVIDELLETRTDGTVHLRRDAKDNAKARRGLESAAVRTVRQQRAQS